MPVPSDITALSTTAASNSPLGSESPATADDYFRAHAAFIAQLRAVIGGAADPNIPNAYATIAQVVDQSQNRGTTAGTSTAYTLAPATALASYSAGKTFWVTFHVASGASPTLQISGLGTPPALVKQQFDGTYAAIAAGDIPLNHRSRVTLISTTQALVESLPAHSDTLNTTRIDIASATTVNLTTGAPNTRHINITGGGAINGFTVAAGQCYFARFNAAGVLANSAGLVTQTGANITTAAGDTCILRATAANVVEVLAYTPFAYPFLREYVSAEQTITSGGLVTLTHGLGVTPKSAIMVLICKTAELGYSVGDELHISQAFDANLRPSALVCGPTTIKVKYSSDATGVFGAANLTSGVFVILTNANWRLIVRAWA